MELNTINIYLNMLIELSCLGMRVVLLKMKFVKSIQQDKQFFPDLCFAEQDGPGLPINISPCPDGSL